MALQTLVKQPAESRLYSMDFGANLNGAGIASVTSVTATPTGLTVGASTISGTKVSFRCSGGTDGVTYKITVVIVDDAVDPNTLEGEGNLQVSEL
jgi:hypothetical protein